MTPLIYPKTPETLGRTSTDAAPYTWLHPYLNTGHNHYFGVITWYGKQVRVEVLSAWKRPDDGDNIYVKSLDGAVFGCDAPPGARANGGAPVGFIEYAVVGVDTHNFVPTAMIVDGVFEIVILAETSLPTMERAAHRQELESEEEQDG